MVMAENLIEVDASKKTGKIDYKIYGHFIENMARSIYGGIVKKEKPGVLSPWVLREEMVKYLKDVGAPVIRWPGGLYADGYNWRDGIGSPKARPLRRNKYWSRYGPITRFLDPNAFGSHEFMELIESVGAQPYINVNFGTSTAEEARDWVEYMNGSKSTFGGRQRAANGREEPYGVKLWGIGNEIYGFWALGHRGPAEYANGYLEFRDAMKEADDGINLVAVGSDHYFSDTWNRKVLEIAGEWIDFLSIHVYLPGWERILEVLASAARHGPEGVYRAIVSAPLELERRLIQVEEDIKEVMGSVGKPAIALDEWNLWWNMGQLFFPRWNLRDALFISGVFHVFHRHANTVKMANIAQFANVLGVVSARGEKVHRTAIYYPFLMYTNLSEPVVVETSFKGETFSSPAFGGIQKVSDIPILDVSSQLSEDGKTLVLFVINRDMANDVEAQIKLEGYNPSGNAYIYLLDAPDVLSVNTVSNDRKVSVSCSSVDVGETLPNCTFPAHSVTALVFGGRDAVLSVFC